MYSQDAEIEESLFFEFNAPTIRNVMKVQYSKFNFRYDVVPKSV